VLIASLPLLPASSLKSKLFSYGDKSSPLAVVASASASNVGAKGKKIEIKAAWTGEGEGLKKSEKVIEKEQDEVECELDLPARISQRHRVNGAHTRSHTVLCVDGDLPGLILDTLTTSSEGSSTVKSVCSPFFLGDSFELS
jgi:hypothetical protein